MGSWNPSSSKTRTCLFFIVNIMGADVLVTQGSRASATIIFKLYCVESNNCNPHTSRVNTLRPRQNYQHFPNNIFECLFLNENVWIAIKISLMFILKGPINNIPALVLIMAWRRPGAKPLSEPMMVRSLMHICVTQPEWVKNRVFFAGNVLISFVLTYWSLYMPWYVCKKNHKICNSLNIRRFKSGLKCYSNLDHYMSAFCEQNPLEQISVKFDSKSKYLLSRKSS